MKTSGNKVGTSGRKRAARSPEARENQLISLAYDEAENEIRNGTASSQIITHFLKLGSAKERLEKEKLQNENELLRAKVKTLENDEQSRIDYNRVLQAMREYSGAEDVGDEDDDFYGDDEYDEYDE